MVAAQRFTAADTFEANFGQQVGLFAGGGADVVLGERIFLDFTVSRYSNSGERAFRFEGQDFRLGIPLTASITPYELSGGYRFRRSPGRRLIPFAGAGIGWYIYKETSTFADSDENVDTQHVGFLATGGVEVRVTRWLGFSGDGRYTYVPGIFGDNGISAGADEHDLGGIAGRVRLIVDIWRR